MCVGEAGTKGRARGEKSQRKMEEVVCRQSCFPNFYLKMTAMGEAGNNTGSICDRIWYFGVSNTSYCNKKPLNLK